jgi:hypothetical protein
MCHVGGGGRMMLMLVMLLSTDVGPNWIARPKGQRRAARVRRGSKGANALDHLSSRPPSLLLANAWPKAWLTTRKSDCAAPSLIAAGDDDKGPQS